MRDDKQRERRKLIETLLREREIPTIVELVAVLRSMGYETAQTTVARDLVEMGVQKVRGLYGRSRYVLPRQEARDPETNAVGTIGAFCTYLDVAATVTIVGTTVGAAGTVGTAIDNLHHPDVVGTLAGYDVVALFCRNEEKAESLREYLDGLRKRAARDWAPKQ